MTEKPNNRRESRYFTGDEVELQQIKSKESLQRFVKRKKVKKRISRLAYLVIFAALVIAFAIICLAVFFKIKAIEITGTTRYSKEQIVATVGIEEGQSLYEISNRDLEILTKKLAYIESARVIRKLPNTLVISIVEDEPIYVSELYGEYFVLSSELRVLDRLFDGAKVDELGLVEIVLPEINSAIVGSKIVFDSDRTERYVKSYLDVLESSDLFDKTTAFDIRDRFNVAVICDGIYLAELGNGDELGTKLSAVAGILDTSVFDDRIPAVIDANDPSECSVIKDPKASIKFE